MTVFKTFNPLKEQTTNEIHNILYSIANSTSRTICFYNDNVGWYFNPIRHLDNVELCLTDARYYNLYALLRDDIYLSKTVFAELNAGYNWNMIDWFEERAHSEDNPVICSHILFLLHKLILLSAAHISNSIQSIDPNPQVFETDLHISLQAIQ